MHATCIWYVRGLARQWRSPECVFARALSVYVCEPRKNVGDRERHTHIHRERKGEKERERQNERQRERAAVCVDVCADVRVVVHVFVCSCMWLCMCVREYVCLGKFMSNFYSL